MQTELVSVCIDLDAEGEIRSRGSAADVSGQAQEGRVHLARSFLLDPVAGAIDYYLVPQVGHPAIHELGGHEARNRVAGPVVKEAVARSVAQPGRRSSSQLRSMLNGTSSGPR